MQVQRGLLSSLAWKLHLLPCLRRKEQAESKSRRFFYPLETTLGPRTLKISFVQQTTSGEGRIPVDFTYVNKKKMIKNMEITYVNQKRNVPCLCTGDSKRGSAESRTPKEIARSRTASRDNASTPLLISSRINSRKNLPSSEKKNFRASLVTELSGVLTVKPSDSVLLISLRLWLPTEADSSGIYTFK